MGLTKDGYFIWNKGSDELLSYSFKAFEFDCQCVRADCVEQKINVALVTKLEALRQEVGKPITINSGFRCKQHQADLAGLGIQTVKQGKTSTHELGDAADIACRLMTPLLTLCEKHFEAIGIAPRFLHVDMRTGKRRRWRY